MVNLVYFLHIFSMVSLCLLKMEILPIVRPSRLSDLQHLCIKWIHPRVMFPMDMHQVPTIMEVKSGCHEDVYPQISFKFCSYLLVLK